MDYFHSNNEKILNVHSPLNRSVYLAFSSSNFSPNVLTVSEESLLVVVVVVELLFPGWLAVSLDFLLAADLD